MRDLLRRCSPCLAALLGVCGPVLAGEIPGEYLADGVRATEAEPSRALELLQSIDFSLESYLDGFWTEPTSQEAEDFPVLWWNRLAGSAEFQLLDWLSADVAAYASATARNELQGVLTYPSERTVKARFVDVTTLDLRFEQEGFDILVGKAPVKMGVAQLFSPSDRFEPTNANNPLHSFDMGRWQGTVNLYWPNDTLTFSVLPFDERDRQPRSDSRWRGVTGDAAVFDLGDLGLLGNVAVLTGTRITEDFRSRDPEDWGYLLKYQGVREGFDLFGAVHYGPGAYPSVEAAIIPGATPTATPSLSLKKTRTDSFSTLGGVTIVLDEWNFYGEGIYQRSFDEGDDDFFKFTVGASYDAVDLADWLDLHKIVPTLEYSYDLKTRELSTEKIRISSKSSRPYRDSILAEITVGIDSDFEVYANTAVNFERSDYLLAFGVDYQYTDNVKFLGQVQLFEGPLDTQFGRFRDNDSVYVGTQFFF